MPNDLHHAVLEASRNPLVRLGRAIEVTGLSETVIEKCVATRRLKEYRIGSRGHRRYALQDLLKLVRESEVKPCE